MSTNLKVSYNDKELNNYSCHIQKFQMAHEIAFNEKLMKCEDAALFL